jgi:hypothetical protein
VLYAPRYLSLVTKRMLTCLVPESLNSSILDAENVGADVKRSQQVKIICSTCLAAFTVVGESHHMYARAEQC